jgi:hypothetical protein
MNPEYPSKDVIDDARRKSISQSIRLVSVEELKKLGEQIFASTSDPWYEKYMRFIADNAGAKFYYAKTTDRFEIIYCHPNNKGIWFFEGMGRGVIRPKNLELIKKIVETL